MDLSCEELFRRNERLQCEIERLKRENEELRRAGSAANSNLFKEALDAVPALISFVDRNGAYLYNNKRYEELFGVDPANLQGRHVADVIGEKAYKMVPKDVRDARASVNASQRIELTNAEGETRVVESSYTPHWDLSGAYDGYFVVANDVTDREIMQEKLAVSEQSYRSSLELFPDAVFVTVDQRVVFANEAARKLFLHDLIGSNLRQFNHPDDRVKILRRRTRVEAAAEGYTTPMRGFRFLKSNGDVFFGESRSTRIFWETQPAHMVIVRDVTDRRAKDEELLTAKQEAEAANISKSKFLANMSHELRTPLNAVIGFAESMHQQLFGPMGNERYLEYCEDIQNAGMHLLEIINDILDLSKIEACEVELDEAALNVSGTIRSCVLLVKARAESAGINLKVKEFEDLPPLYADERMLKQVMINLLSNAIKFTPAGGHVEIRVSCCPDSGYVFEVADTGIGIAPDDIPTVLTSFRQVDSDLNRRFGGTGLGLPLSQSLTQMHGGSLDLHSEVGVGTTATVRFPTERIVSETTSVT